MGTKQETVLEFLEEARVPLPKVITVDRAMSSKYLFYLLVRFYRKRLARRPQFIAYTKSTAQAVKSQMEEHSVFGDAVFYVLEGFADAFVASLSLPADAYVVAETDGGDLKAPVYNYRMRRDILKVLLQELRIKNLSLRPLVALDWSSCRDYGDYEVMLRKAKVMEWSEEEIGNQLVQFHSGPVLTMTKRSQFREVFSMIEKYGANWMVGHIQEVLMQTVHLKALKLLGYDEERATRELEVGYLRMQELEETARTLSREELIELAERLVKLDRLLVRNRDLGVGLLLLNAPIRISR